MRFKELYDQDKDGKLNREEQLRWIAPNSYGSAREEVMSSIMCSAFFLFLFFLLIVDKIKSEIIISATF